MDETALADAYRDHAPAILAHCRRLLVSGPLARDATHEVFVKVLASGKALPGGEEGLRYLYRVATNHCLNQLRDGRVRQRAAADLRVHAGDRAVETPHAERQLILRLLEHSPPRDLEIAVLHWLDGMTQVEIAETMGMSRRGVYSRLRRVEALAARIGETLPGAGAQPDGASSAGASTGERAARGGNA